MQESTVLVVSAGPVVSSLIVTPLALIWSIDCLFHRESLAESFRIGLPGWKVLDPATCYIEPEETLEISTTQFPLSTSFANSRARSGTIELSALGDKSFPLDTRDCSFETLPSELEGKIMRAFKQGRWSPLSPILLLDDNILSTAAAFLNCTELCSLGQVCGRFSAISARESIWKLRCEEILSPEEVDATIAILHLSSYRQLAETFTRIGVPCGVLGLWRTDVSQDQRDPRERGPVSTTSQSGSRQTPHHKYARGELLRITLVGRGFLCETISPEDVIRGVLSVRLSVVNGRVMIGYFNMEAGPTTKCGGGSWGPATSNYDGFTARARVVPTTTETSPIRRCGDNAFTMKRGDGNLRRYVKLPNPPPIPDSISCSLPETVALHLCGLWCASYGSHGLEIVNVSVTSPESEGTEAFPECGTVSPSRDESVSPLRSSGREGWLQKGPTSESSSACTSPPASLDSDATGLRSGSDDSVDSDESDKEEGEKRAIDENDSEYDDDEDESEDDDYPTEGEPKLVLGEGGARQEAEGTHGNGKSCRDPGYASSSFQVEGGLHEENNGKDGDVDCAYSRLTGTKIIGDPNVPSGKLSFVVDLTKTFDVDEELEADTRPLVLFLSSGAVMANLANRRPSILMWFKGKVQMNRSPDEWSPEWVDIDFVVYHPRERCRFSVIVKRPMSPVRVAIDFERTLGEREAWPQWRHLCASRS